MLLSCRSTASVPPSISHLELYVQLEKTIVPKCDPRGHVTSMDSDCTSAFPSITTHYDLVSGGSSLFLLRTFHLGQQ